MDRLLAKKEEFYILGGLTILLLITNYRSLFPVHLLQYGIIPRSSERFIRYLLFHLLFMAHGLTFLVIYYLFLYLAFLLMTQSLREYCYSSIFIIIISGLLVWLFWA